MKNIVLVTLVASTVFMSNGMVGPINSLYVESLGADYLAIGLLGTVTSLTAILFSYVWGRLSDRLGQRRLILLSSIVSMAVSYGLMAAVQDYRGLFPLRILGAAAQAAYVTSSLALMGDLLDRDAQNRGRQMGIFRGLCSLGFGLMAFLSGTLADRLSIRAPFLLAAGLLILAFFVALWIREPAARQVVPVPGTNGAALRSTSGKNDRDEQMSGQRSLSLVPLLLSAFLWSLVTGAVYAVWANYMVSEVGFSRAAMSRLWALASLSEFPLMIFSGWLSDRWGRLIVLSLSFFAWTAVFAGYVFVPTMPWIILIQLTRGFAYSGYTATAMAYATEVRARSQRGATSGLYHSAGGVGSILGSSLGGGLTELTNFQTMLGTNAGLIFVGAVYLWVVHRVRIARTASLGAEC